MQMCRGILTGISLALLPMSGVQASDQWSGFFLGAGGGGSKLQERLDRTFTAVTPFGTTFDGGADEPLFTVLGGYRIRHNNLVFGAEGSFTGIDAEFNGAACPVPTTAACASVGADGTLSNLWRGRVSVGALLNEKTLISIAGGISAADVSFTGFTAQGVAGSAVATATAFGPPVDETTTGYNIGASIERKVSDRVSFRFEGIYDRVDGPDLGAFSAAAFAGDGTLEGAASVQQTGDFPIEIYSFQAILMFDF
ncbi:MAG: hypothetical protein AAF724_04970 [Pseudomonadota bacterium]